MKDRPREVRSNSAATRPLRVADRLLALRIAPLRDVVVLYAFNPESVEVTLARQRFNIRNVMRSELRCQLDDDPARWKVHVKRALRVDLPPVGGS